MGPGLVHKAREVRSASLVACLIASFMGGLMWLSLTSMSPIVRGVGAPGQPITVTGGPPEHDTDLTVLARGTPVDEAFECQGSDGQLGVFETFRTKHVDVSGERLLVIGDTLSTWQPGDVVAPCTGAGLKSVVLLEDPRPARRWLAIGLTFGGVFLAVWTAVLFALTRSTPQPQGQVIEDRHNPYYGSNPY